MQLNRRNFAQLAAGLFSVPAVAGRLSDSTAIAKPVTVEVPKQPYRDVQVYRMPDGAAYWELQDGLKWVTPDDPQMGFFYLTAQAGKLENGVFTAAPDHSLGGVETIVQHFTNPGPTVCEIIRGWPFNPQCSPYVVMRFRLYGNRRDESAISFEARNRTYVWDGKPYRDIVFGPPPPHQCMHCGHTS